MATSDQEQKSINVPMHKRLAQGEKLDGTSLQAKGEKSKAGGLSSVVAKKQK
ncbi:hypothetical protein UFOVP35_71 [uncultured Caudovirales phage]|uniref:Uncharacterized protein n=1 Tax=uncultured Caudovirales phage TaxID=2100421 RepID=A0A6J5KN91_9CAUD|nr:hypothetical protein UFOVP35_71 [uncultured Caudovirales phage]CAB4124770.1 hypothetical protein UFOVP52_52 [uncultured Caudovirales phage]CAB5219965.1 hypothetical protein UFOVP234_77 [uncultured Caudovirales phage]